MKKSEIVFRAICSFYNGEYADFNYYSLKMFAEKIQRHHNKNIRK